MSALTLIAFLFFLNILKECIQEEMHPPTAMIMMVPNPGIDPLAKEESEPMGKYEEVDLKTKEDFVKVRKLLSVEDEEGSEEVSRVLDERESTNKLEPMGTYDEVRRGNVVRGRKLLAVQDEGEEEREGRFIHNFEMGKRDWTNQLSQISEEDLVGQKQKLDQLKKLWHKRTTEDGIKRKPSLEDEVDRIKVKKFINSPVLSDLREIPKLSQYWAKQKTTTQATETKSVEFEEHPKKVADFEEFEVLEGEKSPVLLDNDSAKLTDVAQSLQLRAAPVGEVEAIPDPFKQEGGLNTPRYRRSDEILTTLPTEELFRPEGIQVITPNPTSSPQGSSTPRTYHVYTNPSEIYSNMWKKPTPPTRITTTSTQQSPTEKMGVEDVYFTTSKPVVNRYQPMMYPNHRPSYQPLSRYRYSPNRRVAYEPAVVRQEYYPMSVVGQYGGDEDTSSIGGVFQLIWTLVSSFARPISRIIPQMSSKVGSEAQCFDLLACEAHRLGRYMGPTAKAVATTFSTVLQWVTPTSDKSALDAAVAAGQENSCAEQIAACDDRSGGKSAMTMVAQLMELRGENSRRPKT